MKKATSSLSTTLLGGFLLQLLHISHYTKNISSSSLFITVDALKVLTSSKIKTEQGKKKRADTCMACSNVTISSVTIESGICLA